MLKVVEVIEERTDFPIAGETYMVGRVEDGRYFFSWGPDYPREGEDGTDIVPANSIGDGESGIDYYATAGKALSAMQLAVEAAEILAEI